MSIELPQEFDEAYYRKMKPYAPLKREFLQYEFENFGKKSGVPGSHFCYRENVVKLFSKLSGPVLEIGPGHRPDFIGSNVKYLDLVYQEELQKLYPEMPDKNGGSPHIDYLISDLVAGNIKENFDLVYSAHTFEHQSNPVLFINSIDKVLNPDGLFVAVIPDKNYTFDYYRDLTTLADVLSAPDSLLEYDKRTKLISRSTSHNDAIRHWLGDHGEQNMSSDWVIDQYRELEKVQDSPESYHATVYNYESFKEIFSLLDKNNIINMNLLRVYNTPFLKNEFVAIFGKKEA